jgi:inositol phosphorylceramide mannosyltransferase catalytic subunit
LTSSLTQKCTQQFWTDESALDFIATEYPWFLPTYTSYAHAIQRVDAFRYFVLAHHGGIYLDLDIEPSRPLHPLLQYPAWACRTAPTGISNDALGAAAGHPFYKHVIASLQTYNRNWGLPYVTIMYSTGPLFLSVMWEEYIATQAARPAAEKIWVLSRETHYQDTFGFFYNHEGGSWHGRDMAVIFWMGQHWLMVTVLGVGAGIGVCLAGWWCVKRFGGEEWEVRGYKPIMMGGYELIERNA